MKILSLLSLGSMCFAGWAGAADERDGACIDLRASARLAEGAPVKIVCFGDSITGVYYHSGARRSWCDLLGVALAKIHPSAQVRMINAGVSGNDTAAALMRMERDVLRHAPDLVVVMFGMNDVRSQAVESFRRNLGDIVERVQRSGAEVILMTPNAIGADDIARPPARLLEYVQIVRALARERALPVVDIHSIYAAILARDREAWERLMSDNIHPNMRGHKIFAEEVAWVITGRRVSLAELPPLRPALPRVLARVRAGEPVSVIAMPPYDALIGPALRAKFPAAVVQVTSWRPDPLSLAAIEAQAKEIGWWKFRGESGAQPPDLVVVAVPSTARAPAGHFYRSYTWILNWSLSMGLSARSPQWDCLVALPSVVEGEREGEARAFEAQALDVLGGQDIPWFRRQPGDRRSALELLSDELTPLLAP
jgi:acyl-CoA thioesterase-1